MKIISEMIQGSTEWLTWRRDKITATNAGAIMGLNPYQSARQLWEEKVLGWEKTHTPEELARMAAGSKNEEVARNLFIDELGVIVEPVCGESEVHPFIAASFDGLSQCGKVGVEIKCGKRAHLLAKEEQIPSYYMAQMQHQMYVADLKEVNYVTYFESELLILIVKREDSFIEEMLEKELAFWDCIRTQKSPR